MISNDQPTIGLIVGSTRPGRRAADVARWVLKVGASYEAQFVVLDLADFPLPHLDEPEPARGRRYTQEHTVRWSRAVSTCDGFVIITPEYNHSFSGVLKNALDYLHSEWENKAMGFVGYGGHGGVRAVEHLRSISGQLKMADVRAQVALSLAVDFDGYDICEPSDMQLKFCHDMLEEVISWTVALKALRLKQSGKRDLNIVARQR